METGDQSQVDKDELSARSYQVKAILFYEDCLVGIHWLSHLNVNLTILQHLPSQNELLEKAKKGNIIVYLGTGSGKTYIAIMMIKEYRRQLELGKKAVFLVSSVPLVDQQADAIRRATGINYN